MLKLVRYFKTYLIDNFKLSQNYVSYFVTSAIQYSWLYKSKFFIIGLLPPVLNWFLQNLVVPRMCQLFMAVCINLKIYLLLIKFFIILNDFTKTTGNVQDKERNGIFSIF